MVPDHRVVVGIRFDLSEALQRCDPRVPTGALRIDSSSPGRLRSPPVALVRSGNRPDRPPLLRFCPLQRIKPGRAIRGAIHRTIPLRRCLRSPGAWYSETSGNATRPCGFSPADHAAPGSFVAPYRYPLFAPSRASILRRHRSWGCTLRSVIPARKRRDVSNAPVPRAVLRASIPAGGFMFAGRSTAYCHLAPT